MGNRVISYCAQNRTVLIRADLTFDGRCGLNVNEVTEQNNTEWKIPNSLVGGLTIACITRRGVGSLLEPESKCTAASVKHAAALIE